MRDLGRLRQGITQRAKEASQQVGATVTRGLEAQGLAGRTRMRLRRAKWLKTSPLRERRRPKSPKK